MDVAQKWLIWNMELLFSHFLGLILFIKLSSHIKWTAFCQAYKLFYHLIQLWLVHYLYLTYPSSTKDLPLLDVISCWEQRMTLCYVISHVLKFSL